ncbi:MAG TPA: hypothetical protein VG055_22860 [Planctomycetaceae bacterium]|nr:hypothetical protein [Planctomycetaceae bacterium]
MKAITIYTLALAAAAAMLSVASAGEKHTDHAPAKNADLEKFKALSGVWEMTGAPDEHGAPGGTVSYKVTAGGNAVLETVFAGSEHEMVTLYYVQGNGLALTHYCMLGNRPHMRTVPTSEPNQIRFRCPEGEDRTLEAEEHMHQATFTFLDADHIKSEWVLYKDGKPEMTNASTFVRKKK